MKIVKISDKFFEECKKHNTSNELLFNEDGRPSVLLVKLTYKNNKYKFVVPLRSNISSKTPKKQYFSLPPNKHTLPNHSHGIHYIKMFPISDEYVESYLISNQFDVMIKTIIDSHESDIVNACQKYLDECSCGHRHYMSPDIDGIIDWLYS